MSRQEFPQHEENSIMEVARDPSFIFAERKGTDFTAAVSTVIVASKRNSGIILEFTERQQELLTISKRLSSGALVNPEEKLKYNVELSNFHCVSVPVLLSHMRSSLIHGLSNDSIKRSLQEHGKNIVPPPRERPLWLKFILSFFGGFGPLLFIACFIVFLSWKPFGTPPSNVYNLALAIALLIVIFIAGTFTFFQEAKSTLVLSNFLSMVPPECIVLRNGQTTKLPASELVVGDIIHLETGVKIPSDIRIVSATNLKIDKSILTGESEPVRLHSEAVSAEVTALEASNMAFMGCNVTDGEGVGVVIATGANNQLSKIASQVRNVDNTITSLQREINRFVVIISLFSLLTSGTAILVWVFYLRVDHPGFMTTSSMIANAISVVVAFVPEGLPLALSMGLTIIATRLCATHYVLLKQLSTIETLGSISMLASDKTGTLTQNKMTVTGLVTPDSCYLGKDLLTAPTNIKQSILRVATVCNQSHLQLMDDGSKVAVGSNGLDKALLNWSESENQVDSVRASSSVLCFMPFSSSTKLAAAVVSTHISNVNDDKEIRVVVKGAPEYVLDRCNFITTDIHGTTSDLTEEKLNTIKENLERVASTGCRVIAVAQSKRLSSELYSDKFQFVTEPTPNFPLHNLEFLGLVAVSDPPRVGVKEAVEALHTAGIKVAMVTGDAASTALAIAKNVSIVTSEKVDYFKDFRNNNNSFSLTSPSSSPEVDAEVGGGGGGVGHQLGIFKNEAIVVEGSYLCNITPSEWDFVFEHSQLVFARTTPEQKLEIVKECQARGHRVGVTGDGVNDSPALKRADVGIAMNSGSDVARDASAIVLLRDDFSAIPSGVCEGRLIFTNLRKVIAYQISAGCYSEVLPVLATFFLGMPQPLSSFLMIIISCVTDVFAGVALTAERAESSLMTEPPRDVRTTPLVNFKLILYSYMFYGNMSSFGAFYNFLHYMSHRGPTGTIASPVPLDDDGSHTFPVGYTAGQLINAWNWGLNTNALGADEVAASTVGSSVFFVTLVVSQMGHLLSVRRKNPYFSDAILAKGGGGRWSRLWKELRSSPPLPPIVLAWIGAAVTANIFNEVPAIQVACGTGSVPALYWGMAFGWSLLWFVIAEIRKWLILLFPNSTLAKLSF